MSPRLEQLARAAPATALTLLLFACSGEGEDAVDSSLIHTVKRGDLEISVREQGEVEAAKNTVVTSQLEGEARLIYLIREGSEVQAGEKVAELDVSGIEEKRASQAILVAKAEAALEQARKNLAIMETELIASQKEAESRKLIAELRVEKFAGHRREPARGDKARVGGPSIAGLNAEMVGKLRALVKTDTIRTSAEKRTNADLVPRVLALLGAKNVDLEMGEMANLVLRVIDEIDLARADLKLAEETVMHSRRLVKKTFITQFELERDEISYRRALSKVTLAWNDLQLLIKYTLPETKITLKHEVENSALGLASVLAIGEARRVRERAELRSAEAEFTLARERLDNWNQQIVNAIVRAPAPGIVVYARQPGRWYRIRLGMDIDERQALVYLPDVSTMVARLRVHEAQINRVVLEQPATVKIDAFPGQVFPARVSMLSSLPDSDSRNRDAKVYRVNVLLDKDNRDGALRPGMTATVEIKIGTLEDVLSVPLLALNRRGDVSYVYKVGSAGPVAAVVQLGTHNLTHVEIVAGLEEGDRIYLVEPPGVRPPVASPTAGAESRDSSDPSADPKTNPSSNGDGNSNGGTARPVDAGGQKTPSKQGDRSGR